MSLIPGELERAVAHLEAGMTVVFPTETVYGLGADASNPNAVKRIFAIKGRPANHPLIVHMASGELLDAWADPVPFEAWRLAERFWPGPLTLVLPRARHVSTVVTGGQDTVAVRVPDHPVAAALLQAFGRGLAAPSANRFGRLSPTTAGHVREEFGEGAGMILDGGPCRIGVESTIVSLVGEIPVILRPGAISAGEIRELLGREIGFPAPNLSGISAPGTLSAHYAPKTPLETLCASNLPARLFQLVRTGKRAGILALTQVADTYGQGEVVTVVMPSRPEDYGRDLYAALHRLDRTRCDRLLVESPPGTEEWSAVWDRLKRAAATPASVRL
ncbi:MAG: L-threonylcarbamoyladenylate synthase [Leptospirillia bacterium]